MFWVQNRARTFKYSLCPVKNINLQKKIEECFSYTVLLVKSVVNQRYILEKGKKRIFKRTELFKYFLICRTGNTIPALKIYIKSPK